MSLGESSVYIPHEARVEFRERMRQFLCAIEKDEIDEEAAVRQLQHELQIMKASRRWDWTVMCTYGGASKWTHYTGQQ